MSDPLNPTPSGDLSELGLAADPTQPFDEIPESNEEQLTAPVVEAAEEEAPPIREGPEEAQEAQPVDSGEQDQEPKAKSILELAYEQGESPREDEPELTRLRQENAQYRDLLQQRLEAAEEQVRTLTEPKEPEPEPPASALDSPVVRATLETLREEDPAKYEAALVELAKTEARREWKGEIDELKESLQEDTQSRKLQDNATQIKQGIHDSLATVKSDWGGVYAEVVDDFYNRAQDSLLYKRYQANPMAFLTKTGVQDTVAGLVAELRHAQKTGVPQQSVGDPVASSVETSAGGGDASTRGVDLGKQKPKLSEEEEYREVIKGASRAGDALGDLL